MTLPDPQASFTVEQFLTEWLVLKESNLRPKTSQDYQRVLNKYVYPEFKGVLLKDLSHRQINLFYRKLVEQQVGFRTIRYLTASYGSPSRMPSIRG